jgi:outer membrane lipoprotein carrier protein
MKKILATIAILVSATLATAAPKEGDIPLSKVVEALEKPFQQDASSKAITDFQVEFTQKSRIVSLDRIQLGQGRLAVKFAPGPGAVPMFRWEYEQPTPQQIVSDGRVMWVYVPDNQQVIRSEIDPTAAARADDPLIFLTGLGNLSRNFDISRGIPAKDEAGHFLLNLLPKKPSPFIRELQVAVRREAVEALLQGKGPVFPLGSATIIDPNNNSTLIEFQKVRINQRLTAEHFRFTVPEGVEVIHSTGEGLSF